MNKRNIRKLISTIITEMEEDEKTVKLILENGQQYIDGQIRIFIAKHFKDMGSKVTIYKQIILYAILGIYLEGMNNERIT